MTYRRETVALAVLIVLCVAIGLGFWLIDLPRTTSEEIPPQDHDIIDAEAPEEVQDPPPSAVGDIDDP